LDFNTNPMKHWAFHLILSKIQWNTKRFIGFYQKSNETLNVSLDFD
jgi:hypothetical protein